MSNIIYPLEACYKKDPSIVFRQIAGEAILVPIRQNVGDLESIYTLNETAACIWALLDGQRTLADIRDALVAEFDVSEADAETDLFELIESLLSFGAAVEVT